MHLQIAFLVFLRLAKSLSSRRFATSYLLLQSRKKKIEIGYHHIAAKNLIDDP